MTISISPNTDSLPLTWSLDELAEGDSCSEVVTFSDELFDMFSQISGDKAAVHIDDSFSSLMGFGAKIYPGMLTTLPFSRLLGMFLPGQGSVIHSMKFEYPAPVLRTAKTLLNYDVSIQRILPSLKAVELGLSVINEGRIIVSGTAICMMIKPECLNNSH